jgi:hypothetical protein
MSNRKFRAVILKEEAPYHLDQTLADDFSTMDITLDLSLREENLPETIGIVRDSWYNNHIVVEAEIFEERIAERLSEGELSICPTIIKEIGEENDMIEGFDLFIAPEAHEKVVGEIEEI